jgi:hypothetical protein
LNETILLKITYIFKIIKAPKNTLKHGNERNKQYGGTCAEFIHLNNLNQCCQEEDDEYIGNECYMIHFDSKCYCDVTCNSRLEADCCPDSIHICNAHPTSKRVDPTDAPSRGDDENSIQNK